MVGLRRLFFVKPAPTSNGAGLKDGWFEAIIFRKTRPYIKWGGFKRWLV
jgi:hypothetical protein